MYCSICPRMGLPIRKKKSMFSNSFESGIISPETLASHDCPQNVDKRNDKNTFEIDYVISGWDLVLFLISSIKFLISSAFFSILWMFFPNPMPHNWRMCESSLLAPKFRISKKPHLEIFPSIIRPSSGMHVLYKKGLNIDKSNYNFSPNVRGRITELEGLPFKASLCNVYFKACGPTTKMKG